MNQNTFIVESEETDVAFEETTNLNTKCKLFFSKNKNINSLVIREHTLECRFFSKANETNEEIPIQIAENNKSNLENKPQTYVQYKAKNYGQSDWVILESESFKEKTKRISRNFIDIGEKTNYEELCKENKWRNSDFRHLVFNPKAKTRTFIEHVKKIYTALTFGNELKKAILHNANFFEKFENYKLLGKIIKKFLNF